jgi:hypothetical protein
MTTMKPVLNVAAAFVAGAAAVFLLEQLLFGRDDVRAGPHLGNQADDDAQLRATVRTRLDDLVSHPRAIEVEANEGVVRVSGQVLAPELDGLLTQLLRIPGVRKVHNALSILRDPSGFGEVERPDGPAAQAQLTRH